MQQMNECHVCIILSQRSQSLKARYCMIAFVRRFLQRQSHKDKKFPGSEGGVRAAKEHRGLFLC